MPDLLRLPWRPGRKVFHTIYAQLGPEPSDDDMLIGLLDTAELAAEVCDAHNRQRKHLIDSHPLRLQYHDGTGWHDLPYTPATGAGTGG